MPGPFVKDFDFDLARAVVEQLVEALDALAVGALTEQNLAALGRKQGVYQLYHEGRPVYVGKADKSLRSRLARHRRALSARENMNVANLGFKALYIHRNWTTWTSEDVLIRHYGEACSWNNSGYGGNDPGRNREDTVVSEADFHQSFPIRRDWRVDELVQGNYEANELLRQLKKTLPFLFRYETESRKRWGRGSPKYNGRQIVVERDAMTIDEILREIVSQLGSNWQATRFPSRYILYEEQRRYAHGEIIAGGPSPRS